jgi:hypothetical protein
MAAQIHEFDDVSRVRRWHDLIVAGRIPASRSGGMWDKRSWSLAMSGLEGLMLGLIALIVLDVMALRCGRDSRKSSDVRRDWNS